MIVVPGGLWRGARGRRRRAPAARRTVVVYTDPSRPNAPALGLPGRRRACSAVVNLGGRPPLVVAAAADAPDREPQLHQLLRAEHARAVGHAGRHLRRDPARRRPREAHPQAPGGDAAAALAAGRLERPDAAADRARPGGDHRRRRRARSSASRSPAPSPLTVGLRRPRRGGVPGPRLRHRLVRQDRGRRQRHDQRRSSSR